MSDDEDINTLITDIALIKKDIKQIEKAVTKMDEAVGQNSEILKNLAVQENMLKNNEKRVEILEKKFVQHNQDEVEFHRELNRHLEDIKQTAQEQREKRHKEVMDSIKEMNKSMNDRLDKQDERIAKLENWKWYLVGALALVGFILMMIPWELLIPALTN